MGQVMVLGVRVGVEVDGEGEEEEEGDEDRDVGFGRMDSDEVDGVVAVVVAAAFALRDSMTIEDWLLVILVPETAKALVGESRVVKTLRKIQNVQRVVSHTFENHRRTLLTYYHIFASMPESQSPNPPQPQPQPQQQHTPPAPLKPTPEPPGSDP